MTIDVATFMRDDRAAILDRHAMRRATGVPTISLLVGPVGAGRETWGSWAAGNLPAVIFAKRNLFPYLEWVRYIAERIDLPAAAVHGLALRAGRDPDELFAAWRAKTPADRELFWNTLAPHGEDDLLRAVANLVDDRGSRRADADVDALSDLGDRIVPMIARLAPSAKWPGVLFVAKSRDELVAAGREAVKWATLVPALSIALVVPAGVWDHYVKGGPESRTKALLREGKLEVPAIDAATIEQTLTEAGATGGAVAAIAAVVGVDEGLLELAVAAVRATASPPTTEVENDRARSASERFLFAFLESLPETAGRFELNAELDFAFGPRRAEVDLLCRSPRIAIELDGYFHFRAPDDYRRDRAKDWELQRRGYVVLRFLAEDVIPQLEMIRDRILDALTIDSLGGHP